MQDQTAAVCHPMHFEGSRECGERKCEDCDGFFEPWSPRKFEASSDPTNGLEITVGFLAVKISNIQGSYV